MSLLDPRFWGAIALWTAIVAFGANWHGASVATEKAAAEEVVRTAAAVSAKGTADAKILADERKLRADDRKGYNDYVKETQDAHAEKDRTISCLRSGACRVLAPIRPPHQAQQASSGPAPAGPSQEGYAELSEEAGILLQVVGSEADDWVRKHAEVVDRYERLRVMCTAEDPPTN